MVVAPPALYALDAPPAARVPGAVPDLVARFLRDRADHGARGWEVNRLWRERLVPLLAALGWDLPDPAEAQAPRPRDMDPHACLRLEGKRALFVQVTSPAVRLARAAGEIFALRRHAWSAGLPVSIATSFRELAVYDCRVEPARTDRAGAARILHLTCDAYAARWHELAGAISPAAVVRALAGRDAAGKRRNAVAVDAALAAELEIWRCALARALACRMPALDEQVIDQAVQRTLHGLLVLRMCEDRGLAPGGQRRGLAEEEAIHEGLLARARALEARCGPGLLDAGVAGEPALATPMDDGILRAILARLQAPDSAYAFSVMSPEVLGQVYERALGRRLRVTGHGRGAGEDAADPPAGEAALRAVLEDRAEARRAGGIYYTPRHLVDHVVRHTVGALLQGKTPRQARGVRILDPACGAGSFLLGAYQYLVHWHEQAYLRAGGPADRARLCRGAGGWRLSTRERLRILASNLHGVDIDPRAVAMTRLSLLLEALDGAEDPRPAARLVARAAGALHANIRCGNALVAPDFLAAHGRELDPEHARRVRAFDWARAFPGVLGRARPGFDVVLGNPPWGQKGILESAAVKAYVRDRFQSLQGHYDLFRPFVEQGIRLLRRGSGHFGMVLPDIVLLKDYQETRRYLLDNLALTHIDWWGMPFPAAVIDAATIVGVKRPPPRAHAVHVAVRAPGGATAHPIPQADFRANERYVFNLALTPERRAIVARLARGPRLGDFFEAHEGVHSGNMRAALFVDHAVDASCRPLLLGRDEIAPYRLRWAGAFIHLDAASRRRRGAHYANTGRPAWFQAHKLLVRRTGDHVLAAVDRDGRYASNNFFVVLPRRACALGLDGLCALLNSRLMTWYFRAVEPRKGRAFAELKIKHLSAFPLPDAAGAGSPGRGACAALDALGAERARLAAALAGDPPEAPALARRCHALDREIDAAVYALFDMRADEIRIIDEPR